jgi:hypothetical protein
MAIVLSRNYISHIITELNTLKHSIQLYSGHVGMLRHAKESAIFGGKNNGCQDGNHFMNSNYAHNYANYQLMCYDVTCKG